MFIQIEITPNPETLKFLPGRIVLPEGEDFRDIKTARERSSLVTKLFSISSGISAVFLGYNFIAVTKKDTEWDYLKPVILGTIMEHFVQGLPVINHSSISLSEPEEFFDVDDSEIVIRIKDLLETRIRPALARDGGDVVFHGFKKGVVYLNMRGACSGCPSSSATLKHGIENLLRYFIPEIIHVETIAR